MLISNRPALPRGVVDVGLVAVVGVGVVVVISADFPVDAIVGAVDALGAPVLALVADS